MGHQHWWLAGGYIWPGNRILIEVASMVVTWCLAAFLWVYYWLSVVIIHQTISFQILLVWFFFFGLIWFSTIDTGHKAFYTPNQNLNFHQGFLHEVENNKWNANQNAKLPRLIITHWVEFIIPSIFLYYVVIDSYGFKFQISRQNFLADRSDWAFFLM